VAETRRKERELRRGVKKKRVKQKIRTCWNGEKNTNFLKADDTAGRNVVPLKEPGGWLKGAAHSAGLGHAFRVSGISKGEKLKIWKEGECLSQRYKSLDQHGSQGGRV